MKRLFIIGNGFDCYMHYDIQNNPMKTEYGDFKKYIISRFPDRKYDFVPETSLTMDHHDYAYDDNKVAGYILKIIDSCAGKYWNDLEERLGDSLLDVLSWDLVDIEKTLESDNENDWFHDAYINEDLSGAMLHTFCRFRELFEEWVNNSLFKIDYDLFKAKHNVKEIFDEMECEFITFNYTLTLEKLYGISESQVHHFHGKVGNKGEDIIFGHGEDGVIGSLSLIGAEDSLNELKNHSRKDTDRIISQNSNFYESLKDITEIYSFGFSFSSVDMPYIEKLSKYIEPSKVKWYFNQYDTNEKPEYFSIIRALGYDVKTEQRW